MTANGTTQRYSHGLLWLPAVVSVGWQLATLFMFMSGIWTYPLGDPWPVFWFVCGTQVCFVLGYALSMREGLESSQWSAPRGSPSRFVWWSAAVTLLLFIPTSIVRTGRLLPNVVAGIRQPGLAYAASFLSRMASTRIAEYARMPFGFLTAALEPVLIFYWSKLGRRVRIAGVLGVVSTLALYVGSGTNKGVFDVVTLAAVFVTAAACAHVLVVKRSARIAIALVLVLSIVGFLSFFSGVAFRAGSGLSFGAGPAGTGVFADLAGPVISRVPSSLRVLALSVTSYASQGYYGLALALTEPFVPMYGAGSSLFLTRQVARLTQDPGFEGRSYPARVERDYGWSASECWSTLYAWLASDVGFPSVLLVMVVVGWLVGSAWLGVVFRQDVLSVCLLAQMATMLSYASANNQVMQSGESLVAFALTLFLWCMAELARLHGMLPVAESNSRGRRSVEDEPS